MKKSNLLLCGIFLVVLTRMASAEHDSKIPPKNKDNSARSMSNPKLTDEQVRKIEKAVDDLTSAMNTHFEQFDKNLKSSIDGLNNLLNKMPLHQKWDLAACEKALGGANSAIEKSATERTESDKKLKAA